MDFSGELLLPGQIGQFLLVLSLVASSVACFAYLQSFMEKDIANQHSWKKLGRIAFAIDAFSVIAVFFILVYLIANHRYEYNYIYKNSDNSLEPKYVLSSLWSASEGSFLLWTIWHGVLGLVLIKTSKKWEGPVMAVLSFAQLCLSTMLVGTYFFGYKIGVSPFVLLRNEVDLQSQVPIFANPEMYKNYLSVFKDGNGLTPLLQNYWMVIHPPVLFLGFALTIVPFAFAIGGLLTKNYTDWVKPALPWALLSAGILGLGIMMGGAWAYESLSFGGYWAWDPVENASLVPWLTMVSGIHTMLIYKHTGRSLRASHLFLIISFLLILYSTFLTRSGILGDTSVHSFADLGMNTQLLLFLLIFVIPALVLFGLNYKKIPFVAKEEATSSREFWMFVGSLVLFLSAIFIIAATSLPVINKIFGSKFTMGEEVEFAYNRIMIFVAFILGTLTAITQYLKYKQTSSSYFWKRIGIATIISFIIAALVLAFGNINYTKHGAGFQAAIWLAIVSSVYTVVANLGYIWTGFKGKLALSGGSVAHFGFGLVLVGMLLSSAKKEILSYNTSGIIVPFSPDTKEKAGENLTLIKGLRTDMGKYWVTYASDSAHPKKQQSYYKLDFERKDGKEKFELEPNAFVNYRGNQGLMANPDARHYWNYDVFTYLTAIQGKSKEGDTASFKTNTLHIGDSAFYSHGYVILEKLEVSKVPDSIVKDGKLYQARLKVYSQRGNTYTSVPKAVDIKGAYMTVPDTLIQESLVFQINKASEKNLELGIKETDSVQEFVALKAYKFPFINILWLGIIITVAGFIISMVRRVQLNRNSLQAVKN